MSLNTKFCYWSDNIMELAFVNKFKGLDKYKKVILTLILFILLVMAITAQMLYLTLSSDKIYKGTFIENVDVGGLTKSEANKLLTNKFTDNIQDKRITLNSQGKSKVVGYEDIGVDFNTDHYVNQAYEVGRQGNLFNKVFTIWKTAYKTIHIELKPKFNEEKYQQFTSSLDNEVSVKPVEHQLNIASNQVAIKSGSKGRQLDKDALKSVLIDNVEQKTDFTVNVPFIESLPKKLNPDEIYQSVNVEAQNAYTEIVNNTVVYRDAVPGRTIDKNELNKVLEDLSKTENFNKILPVTFTQPKLKTSDLKPLIFRDTLFTFGTQFYTGSEIDANRGENIRIGTSKVNGKILGPGEVFSFNEVAGPRTENEGYKVAKAYSDGQVIDDVGGGICQVSSTLYNAALFSDLGIVSRTNHMFTVGYLPKGQDAAVAYNSLDFKFKNTTNYPILVEGKVTSDNRVIFTIKGTNETPGKTVEVVNNLIKTIEAPIKYIDDPTMNEGNSYVKTNGMTGYIVESYKITKQNGVVVKEEKLHTSNYQPLPTEIVRGTKKP